MAVQFQDYYKTLEVSRDASADEISKAFRRLARKYHPDINKDKDAEEKFKLLNEANEVLGDPEKRARYDQLGANWQAGQDFRPPPGWEQMFSQFSNGGRSAGGKGGMQFSFGSSGGAGGFSDFFDMLFGGSQMFQGERGPGADPFAQAERERSSSRASITVPLEDAYRGGTKAVSLEATERNSQGVLEKKTKKYQIKIPSGTMDGSVIRMANLGGQIGDLLLTIKIAPHRRFRLEGKDIVAMVPLAPWEAALGGKIQVETLDGAVSLNVPAGSQTGQRLRLRGKGFAPKGQTPGDMFVELQVAVPKELSEKEKELFGELQKVSNFNPRQ